jgi:hypothetical protein
MTTKLERLEFEIQELKARLNALESQVIPWKPIAEASAFFGVHANTLRRRIRESEESGSPYKRDVHWRINPVSKVYEVNCEEWQKVPNPKRGWQKRIVS